MSVTPEVQNLRFHQIPHPLRPQIHIQVFRDSMSACQHLRDHLLTAPECYAWGIVCPEFHEILDIENDDTRFYYWEEAKRSNGASAQLLYDIYSEAIRLNSADAAILKWIITNSYVTIVLGLDGVVVVINDRLSVVASAYLPGQGDARGVQDSRSLGRKGFPRERPMRNGRPSGRREALAERDRRVMERREENWNLEQKLYYRVFRPAVQYVRRYQRAIPSSAMHSSVVSFETLKTVLPPVTQLKWEDWQNLRRLCGREVIYG